jgi:hypothetical protein
MTLFARLIGFFVAKRISAGTALSFVALTAILVFVGMLTGARTRAAMAGEAAQRFGSALTPAPVVSVDVGSVHTQVWEATNLTYLATYPGGILLPLRLSSRWLFIILPLVGLLLASREVSQELESGVAQSVYAAPVRPSVLGVARVLGDSVGIALLIGMGLAVALLVAGRFVRLGLTSAQLVRSVAFVIILGFYTSLFVLVGNLMSALLRTSIRAVWACIAVALIVFAGQMAGENLFIARHRSYPTVPLPPRAVNEYLYSHSMWLTGVPSSADELAADATPEVLRYLIELEAHGQRVFEMVQADYQRERWFAAVSPVHALWEIAGQLLQDRHVDATEIFAPIPPLDPPPSIGTSLRRVWPELLGMVVFWLALFGLNVRVLSRIEV